MPDNSGAINLGDLPPEAQEELSRMAEETGAEPGEEFPVKRAHTAFIVFVADDGTPEVMAFEDEGVEIRVQPTTELIRGACTNVIQNLNAQETALVTIGRQMQQAQAMAQQMQAEQIRQGLKL